ncbi:hypothetical protein JCM8547_006411 [Rhodosporidiobolus lusitaniae]
MPVPPLPNELITLIFEHLYDELSTDRTTGDLIVPLHLHYFFFPLLLVSRTFHALSLRFFLSYTDRRI